MQPDRPIVIAFVGDSMVDTMRTDFPFLTEHLQWEFPGRKFVLYNYGVGAENIETGFARMEEPFVYKDRDFPSLVDLAPDIVIVGSWAYNPFSPHDPKKHKELLTAVVKQAWHAGPAKVFLLKELAPLDTNFGNGVLGVNWEKEQAREHAGKIIKQLENVDIVGRELRVPVINVYSPSVMPGSLFGKPEFVTQTDGVHASPMGHRLTADIIVRNITLPERIEMNEKLVVSHKGSWSIVKTATIPKPKTVPYAARLGAVRTIMGNMTQADRLTTMTSVTRASKINTILEGTEAYTVFAPENEAFESIDPGKLAEYVYGLNTSELEKLVKPHIVKGSYKTSDLIDGMELKAIDGTILTISNDSSQIRINNASVVLVENISSKNGVIHIISAVVK